MKSPLILALAFLSSLTCWAELPFPAQPLEPAEDRSAAMVDGIRHWLERATAEQPELRSRIWQAAVAGGNWTDFLQQKRERLKIILGMVDARAPGPLEEVQPLQAPTGGLRQDAAYQEISVRWPVSSGVHGEGVLLRPTGTVRGAVIVIPDADEPPERSAAARRLAREGWCVLAMTLVDRRDDWSGSAALGRWTNQPHREWIYRQAFELGRTLIGYEVQKVLAGLDALERSALLVPGSPIAVHGAGEGGLLALASAALDDRIQSATISGYFGPREGLFAEPIYRNLFGFLREFGDAELVAMAGRCRLTVEDRRGPEIAGPPPATADRRGAAPGVLATPALELVEAEVARANALREALHLPAVALMRGEGRTPLAPEVEVSGAAGAQPSQAAVDARQRRTVQELESFTQSLVAAEERGREAGLWAKLKPGPDWEAAQGAVRDQLWRQVIGKIEQPLLPPAARARLLFKRENWSAYEVMLEALPDVPAWGWLLVPHGLAPGERRPVVVCQHGLEGLPEDVVTEDPGHPAFHSYQGFAARLATQGYVVFAPHNPYRGKDAFRTLQRRANPLGLSLFSFILAQHDAALHWLRTLPFVDGGRIGFYGLSYGGKSAMRLPALLDGYCLSICSGDFNEWVRKNVSLDYRGSYMLSPEYEMPEWNLANVANYAEMAMLIAPRPFMVERGHRDGVGMDEWVGYEYAKVRRGYDQLGIGAQTEIEWFDGPHTIHGQGTFDFLRRHLGLSPSVRPER